MNAKKSNNSVRESEPSPVGTDLKTRAQYFEWDGLCN